MALLHDALQEPFAFARRFNKLRGSKYRKGGDVEIRAYPDGRYTIIFPGEAERELSWAEVEEYAQGYVDWEGVG